MTGVERYSRQIVAIWEKFKYRYKILVPAYAPRSYLRLWEQALSFRDHKDLIWCPANTGPLLYRNKVLTLHDGAAISNPEWFRRKTGFWRKIEVPKLIESSLIIITVSDFSKENLCRHTDVDPDRIRRIYNGIDHDFFSPRQLRPELRSYYGIEKPYLLFVGSLEPRKNLQRLFSAWRMLPNSYRDEYELLVIGSEGICFRKQQLDIPDGVRLLGYVSDVDLPYLYSGAEVFLYPSLLEGFGLPILEAMACGVPVLTSNTTAMPEVGGNAAFYVEPTDIEAIAAGMIKLIDDKDLRMELIEKGLQRAQQFSWDNTADQTWAVLKEAEQYI